MKRLVCNESLMWATLFFVTFTSVENKWEDLLCSIYEFVREDHVICFNIMIVKCNVFTNFQNIIIFYLVKLSIMLQLLNSKVKGINMIMVYYKL